jgi:hypothetical protein
LVAISGGRTREKGLSECIRGPEFDNQDFNVGSWREGLKEKQTRVLILATPDVSQYRNPNQMEGDEVMSQLKTRIQNLEKVCATSDPELEKDARALVTLNISVGLLDSSIDIEQTVKVYMEKGFTLSRLFRDIAAVGRGLPKHKLGKASD